MAKILTDADVPPRVPGTYLMPPPPQIAAHFSDPMVQQLKPSSDEWCFVEPENPPKDGESRFVYLHDVFYDPNGRRDPIKDYSWTNKPRYGQGETYGGGLGFGSLKERPAIHCKLKPNRLPDDIMFANQVLLVSPAALKVFQEFAGDDLEIVAPLWTEDSSDAIRSHVFLDVRRVLDSYNYARTRLRFDNYGACFSGQVATPRCFRDDLPANVHLFHDLFFRHPFILSRELAHALRKRAVTGLYVLDPASMTDALYWEDQWGSKANGGDQP